MVRVVRRELDLFRIGRVLDVFVSVIPILSSVSFGKIYLSVKRLVVLKVGPFIRIERFGTNIKVPICFPCAAKEAFLSV